MMNILNGGAHADNNVDFQEFMVMPVGADELSRRSAMRRRDISQPEKRPEDDAATRPASATKAALRQTSRSNEEAIETDSRSDRQGRLQRRAQNVMLALDPAASEFYKTANVRVQEER